MKKKLESTEAKQKILKTASDLFYRQGYLATGINQVIAEAKVAKNTFYYHFPSKEDLCLAYLKDRHRMWMWWFQDKVGSCGTPYERLIGVFDFLETWMKNSHYRGCPFLNISSEVPDMNSRLRREVAAHADALRETLRKWVEEYRSSSVVDPGLDVQQTADALFLLFEGATLACQSYGDLWPVAVARENFKKMLAGSEYRTDLSGYVSK